MYHKQRPSETECKNLLHSGRREERRILSVDRAGRSTEIKNLSERFGKVKTAFLVDFKGINVEQVTRLRKILKSNDAELRVVRNTLARLAIKEHPEKDKALGDKFIGTNAVVFVYGDPGTSAKTLADFGKEVEALQFKCGIMEGTSLDKDKMKYLATLPGKDELRAQLVAMLQAPLSQYVRQLAAPARSFLTLLDAYKKKQS